MADEKQLELFNVDEYIDKNSCKDCGFFLRIESNYSRKIKFVCKMSSVRIKVNDICCGRFQHKDSFEGNSLQRY